MDHMAHASALASRPLGGMVPDPALLTPAHETELVRADGRPQPAFREQLRKIPSWRNAWSVVSVWLQAALILGLAVWWGNPAGYVVAFLLMGRTQAQLASLMHESAHRLLFSGRRLNDFVGYWWLYPVFWLLPFLTVWRVINRLRSIAEHGGMDASPDRRATTHTVRQSWWSRTVLVPFNIGWHLAHHVDAGISMRHLPRYHRALCDAGYVTPELEYHDYRALWRALRRGTRASAAQST